MKVIKYILSIIILLSVDLAFGDDSAAQVLMQDLSSLQHATGKFTQAIEDQNGKTLQKTQGNFALSRPVSGEEAGKFLWHTQNPEQVLVADGKKIWFYDPSLQQVTVQKQQVLATQNSPAMLLSGNLSQISKAYTIQLRSSESQQIFLLKPIETQNSFFSELKIIFKNASVPTLSEMDILDNLGQKTEIKFFDLSNLSEEQLKKLFQFKAPKGVDVVQS